MTAKALTSCPDQPNRPNCSLDPSAICNDAIPFQPEGTASAQSVYAGLTSYRPEVSKAAYLNMTMIGEYFDKWCLGPDLNRHDPVKESQDFLTTIAFATSINSFRYLCSLWSGLCLDLCFRFRSRPSSLYTFLHILRF